MTPADDMLTRFAIEPATRLTGFLTRFTYKPRWHFRVFPASHGLFSANALQITMHTQDVNWPHGLVPVVGTVAIPEALPVMTDDQVMEWLREQIRRVELHEVDEWFKVDGKAPFDPHAKGNVT